LEREADNALDLFERRTLVTDNPFGNNYLDSSHILPSIPVILCKHFRMKGRERQGQRCAFFARVCILLSESYW